jgi:hypothetical protein
MLLFRVCVCVCVCVCVFPQRELRKNVDDRALSRLPTLVKQVRVSGEEKG